MILLLAAALVCGPITLMGQLDPPEIPAFIPPQFVQSVRLVAKSRTTRSWFSAAARWDSTTLWPKGQEIVVVTKDGRSIASLSVMAMTPRPECVPIPLGIADRRIDPSAVDHGRSGRVVLFVSFPDPRLGIGDVAEVRLRQRVTGAAASAPTGGTP